jgi:hypothetical protein
MSYSAPLSINRRSLNIIRRLTGAAPHLFKHRMKFEIKTEPVCAVLIAVPAYAAVVIIIVIATGISAQDAWFPLSVVMTILMIGLNYVSK